METPNLPSRTENPGLKSDLPGGPSRILIVEDNPSIRDLLTEVLMGAGYHVDAASDGGQAWSILQAHSYDLIITDNNMPSMTGLELLQKLDSQGCVFPVIMATTAPPWKGLNNLSNIKLHAVLLKPFEINDLLITVKSALPTEVK